MPNFRFFGGPVLEISRGGGGGGVCTRYSVLIMELRLWFFCTLLDI
jgi:hypothetical protein